MKPILLILTVMLLGSCTKQKNENTRTWLKNIEKADQDWSNPILIKGSSLGVIINSAYKIGDFELLYKLTDSVSKEKYPKREVFRKFKDSSLGFEMSLVSTSKLDSIQILNYSTSIVATSQLLRVPVIVQDDTARVLLDLFIEELQKIRR